MAIYLGTNELGGGGGGGPIINNYVAFPVGSGTSGYDSNTGIYIHPSGGTYLQTGFVKPATDYSLAAVTGTDNIIENNFIDISQFSLAANDNIVYDGTNIYIIDLSANAYYSYNPTTGNIVTNGGTLTGVTSPYRFFYDRENSRWCYTRADAANGTVYHNDSSDITDTFDQTITLNGAAAVRTGFQAGAYTIVDEGTGEIYSEWSRTDFSNNRVQLSRALFDDTGEPISATQNSGQRYLNGADGTYFQQGSFVGDRILTPSGTGNTLQISALTIDRTTGGISSETIIASGTFTSQVGNVRQVASAIDPDSNGNEKFFMVDNTNSAVSKIDENAFDVVGDSVVRTYTPNTTDFPDGLLTQTLFIKVA